MIGGVLPLETSYLVPDPVFLLVFVAVFGVLLLWPLVEALTRGRLGWAVAILLLAPVAGILWFAVGRRTRRPA
jgi:hypothetical protein